MELMEVLSCWLFSQALLLVSITAVYKYNHNLDKQTHYKLELEVRMFHFPVNIGMILVVTLLCNITCKMFSLQILFKSCVHLHL